MKKILHQFLLLAVLSFMPIFGQAQVCSLGGDVTQGPTTTPFLGGWKVALTFNPTLTWSDCLFDLTQLSSISSGDPDTYTKNGVTVNIKDAKIRLKSGVSCASITGNDSVFLFLARCSAPQSLSLEVVYTLTGKSTTSDPNIVLFPAQLTSVTPATRNFSSTVRRNINVPVSPSPTCSLTVPSILTVPNATLSQFVLTGLQGTKTEAKGTNFNVRINCATPSTSFTPKVTFSYGEGVACMPGNGWATAATAAQGIGYAIKTSVTGSNASDYICGNSGSGTNVVSFPATTANAVYDQSKTFFVNYAIQGSRKTTGIVQTSVTLTATFN